MGTIVILVTSKTYHANAFVFNHAGSPRTPIVAANSANYERTKALSKLWYTDTPDTLLEIDAAEIRDELESYGISTGSMFERGGLEEDLTKTESSKEEKKDTKKIFDAEGTTNTIREKWLSKWNDVGSAVRKVVEKYATGDSSSTFHSTNAFQPNEPRISKKTRREKYKDALEEGRSMKTSALRQELKDRGISTDAFFDKSDLLESYANAVAYDLDISNSKTRDTKRQNEQSKTTSDPSYRDVIVHAFDPRALMAGDVIIDITEG